MGCLLALPARAHAALEVATLHGVGCCSLSIASFVAPGRRIAVGAEWGQRGRHAAARERRTVWVRAKAPWLMTGSTF